MRTLGDLPRHPLRISSGINKDSYYARCFETSKRSTKTMTCRGVMVGQSTKGGQVGLAPEPLSADPLISPCRQDCQHPISEPVGAQ